MFVILVYDVNTKRVNKVHKLCKKYLTWVQNSVFEGEISEASLEILKEKLDKVLRREEDSILIYKFRTKKYYQREFIGIKKPSHEEFMF